MLQERCAAVPTDSAFLVKVTWSGSAVFYCTELYCVLYCAVLHLKFILLCCALLYSKIFFLYPFSFLIFLTLILHTFLPPSRLLLSLSLPPSLPPTPPPLSPTLFLPHSLSPSHSPSLPLSLSPSHSIAAVYRTISSRYFPLLPFLLKCPFGPSSSAL